MLNQMESIKLLVKNNGKYVDVTGRRVILWGAGRNLQPLCYSMQIDSIACVVDSSSSMWQKKVVLLGDEYVIETPDAIKEYDENRCFIMITSTNYRDEIKKNIQDLYGDRYLICEKKSDFLRQYTSLQELLYKDPIIVNAIARGNLSLCMKSIESKVLQKIKEHISDNLDELAFSPLDGATRVTFLVWQKKVRKYIVHIPVRSFREEYNPSNTRSIAIRYEDRKKLGNLDKLCVYVDNEGIEIEKYAETDCLDWSSEETVSGALEELRLLHDSNISLRNRWNPIERVISNEKYIVQYNGYFPEQLSVHIHDLCFGELSNIGMTSVCHGDVHLDNFAMYKGKMVLIDWEWVGMSDPMWDICMLYSNLKNRTALKYSLGDFLQIYYGYIPSQQELKRARLIYVLLEYYLYCIILRKNNCKNEERENKIWELLRDI
ncbi:phosphotransferase [Butyrivibrio sp. M55]|uniref:phosphotransferase n=1 Tax=Butyrivibrio sp. M55 TaxID=1855323 RepID=UPI0008E179EA|nr:phosphotransferase [Butyrivibrio sp. M55]SFU66070.1 Thiamine kinase [Butyrivibrio sp. M55]